VKLRWILVAVVAFACALRCTCRESPRESPREPLRIATFNIEKFPQSGRQIDGAFSELRDIHAGIIAVQEIGDPDLFAREARRRLGDRYKFVSADTRPIGERRPGDHLGVLYDSATWTLAGTQIHDDARLAGGRHKPVLDVRLQRGTQFLHVLVVHFKSGSEGRTIRAAQYRGLRAIVRRVQRANEPIVLMGDFNATAEADRDDLAALARDAHMTWASEPLACTAFWVRDDGCPRSRLDHILTWTAPSTVEVAGACAREGCEWQASCPLYEREVSDHCPVVVTFN
jgi:endonuclease/exonuclease/phosphatase family metal-dependent hydrolase